MKQYDNGLLDATYLEQELTLYGWVQKVRYLGKLTFINLRDSSGIIQIIYKKAKINLNLEDVLEVKGVLKKRKDINYQLKTGQFELLASHITILNKAQELPFAIRDDDQSHEELRFKYRYLDLRKPEKQAIIKLRSLIDFSLRSFLHKNDFIEITTPLLSKSTPEGARDFLVATRRVGAFYSLPQSPQLYKQLLMASGFEKYFQIAHVFRDEDGRKDRHVEFSQLDIEIAFKSPQFLQTLVEKMLKALFVKLGYQISIPFPRLDYQEIIKNYGSDKPDLRFNYLLEDLSSDFSQYQSEQFKNDFVNALYFDQTFSTPETRALEISAQQNQVQKLYILKVKDSKIINSPWLNQDLDLALLNKSSLALKKLQTIVIVADQNYQKAKTILGALRTKADEIKNFKKTTLHSLAWVINWPMFTYDEAFKKYLPANNFFSMYDRNTLVNGELDFSATKATSYDLIFNGFEIASGSERIHDFKIQKQIFDFIGLSDQEREQKFGFFLEAFKYGLPPHCGIAIGLERLVYLLTKAASVREVIAFPKSAQGYDYLTNSPSAISQAQLDELSLKIDTK